jgi:hypothetical protein
VSGAFVCDLGEFDRCDRSATREDVGSIYDGDAEPWVEMMLPSGSSGGRVFSEGPYHFCSVEHEAEWLARRRLSIEIEAAHDPELSDDERSRALARVPVLTELLDRRIVDRVTA